VRAHLSRSGWIRRAVLLVAVAAIGSACGGAPTTGSPDDNRTVAAVGTATTWIDPGTGQRVPLATVETGGGHIEVVALWRQGPFVRLVVSGREEVDGFELSGRFGPVQQQMQRALLVDPEQGTVYRVLQGPRLGSGVPGECLCSRTIPTPRLKSMAYADFRVPEQVKEVVVLGDSTPPLGRHPVAGDEPDLDAAGYSWLRRGAPPELGSVPFDEELATSSVRPASEPGSGRAGAGGDDHTVRTLPSDVLFAPGSTALDPDGQPLLDESATVLRTLPTGTAVRVVVHTETQGGAEANLVLTQGRAATVVGALNALLQDADLALQPEGRGGSEPVAPDTGPDGQPIRENQAQNRRIELRVSVEAAARATPPLAQAAPPTETASRVPGSRDELATVEVTLGGALDERVQIGVVGVTRDADFGGVRVDLREELMGARSDVRTSARAVEALGDPQASSGGARDLRLVEGTTGPWWQPSTTRAGDCLCADQQSHPLIVGHPERLSVWFPVPDGVSTVSLWIPRAGLIDNLKVA
jgi:outer membrane protein OmpA-like peptidoglycan-associated protein